MNTTTVFYQNLWNCVLVKVVWQPKLFGHGLCGWKPTDALLRFLLVSLHLLARLRQFSCSMLSTQQSCDVQDVERLNWQREWLLIFVRMSLHVPTYRCSPWMDKEHSPVTSWDHRLVPWTAIRTGDLLITWAGSLFISGTFKSPNFFSLEPLVSFSSTDMLERNGGWSNPSLPAFECQSHISVGFLLWGSSVGLQKWWVLPPSPLLQTWQILSWPAVSLPVCCLHKFVCFVIWSGFLKFNSWNTCSLYLIIQYTIFHCRS